MKVELLADSACLVVIRLGVTRLKKTSVVYLLDLFGRRGEKGQCDLVCGVPLDDWTNAGLCWCLILILRDKKYVALLQGSEISAGWLSRNLILGTNCCRIMKLIAYQWPNYKHGRVQPRRSNFFSWEGIIYGLSSDSLCYIYYHLIDCKQCVQINNEQSEFDTIISGVPQGPIFEPILCNIFLQGFFLFYSKNLSS